MADRADFPPGEAREDWAILRALSGALGKPLPFDSLAQLRAQLYAALPHLARIDGIEPAIRSGAGALPQGDTDSAGRLRLARSPISISPTRSRAPRT